LTLNRFKKILEGDIDAKWFVYAVGLTIGLFPVIFFISHMMGVAIKIMPNKDTYFFIGGFGVIAIILYIITFNETIQLYFPEAPIIFTIIAYFSLLIIFNYKEIKVNLHEMF